MKRKKRTAPRKARRLPTLAECEKAIGERAQAWVARCYEVSCAIVSAKLVDGVAVYGHWLGDVAPGSHFANRARALFVPHGWILLDDSRVLDPTRWVFENVEPYLYVGEPPDPWGTEPCENCRLLKEEHRDGGPEDQCDMYEPPRWPYDEGGNRWREAITAGRPVPVANGPLKKVALAGFAKTWLGGVLGVPDASKLSANQLIYVANMSYDVVKRAVGPDGLRMIYEAIVDFDDTSIAWLPIDNLTRARRECGLAREY